MFKSKFMFYVFYVSSLLTAFGTVMRFFSLSSGGEDSDLFYSLHQYVEVCAWGIIAFTFAILARIEQEASKNRLAREENDEVEINKTATDSFIDPNKCRNCGNKLQPDQNFCEQCGAQRTPPQ